MHECAMDQELYTKLLGETGGCSGRRADAACALSRRQYFSVWNDVMGAILKVLRHTKTLTIKLTHIHLKNNPVKYRSNRCSLRRLLKSRTIRTTITTRWVAIWNQFLIWTP